MPITSSDIKFYFSGGASNTDPNASLGGGISTTEISSGALHNLFRKILGDESATGKTIYRAFYVKNTHASLTLEDAKVWFTSLPAAGTISVGIEASKGSPKQTIANESTAPTGITFSTPTTKASGLSLGNLNAADVYMIWLRLTIAAGTNASNNNSFSITVEGDSAA